MKTLIATALLIFSTSAHALQCGEIETTKSVEESSIEVITDVPKHLKGKEICIRNPQTGVSDCVKAEEYMVVKRKHKRPVIKESTKETSLACKTETKEVSVAQKNIVSLKAVDGYSDVKKEQTGKTLKLEVERQVGVGLQYQRAITDKLYLGGEVDSNKGVGVLLGVGF